MTLSVGDLLVFSTAGITYQFGPLTNFIQRVDSLSAADRAVWVAGSVPIAAYHGIQIGNYVYIASPSLHKVFRTDLDLLYVDDFWTVPPLHNGDPTTLAYSQSRGILYIATMSDDDAVFPASDVSIYAVDINTGITLGRYNVLPTDNRDVIALIHYSSRASGGGATNIFLSPDEDTLYVTQTNNTYAVWASVVNPNGSLVAATAVAFVDAKQPTYWRDVRNWDADPLNLEGCGTCPTSPCTYFTWPPHEYQVLDDGTSYTGPGADGPSLGGAKLDTRQFFGVYNGVANQYITLDGQPICSARFVCTDPTGKIYLAIEQARSNQFMQIRNYPSAPLFHGIMQSNYSCEPHLDVFPANGGGRLSRCITNPVNTNQFSQTGCYASSGQTAFPDDPIFGVVASDSSAYTVQTSFSGITKISLATGLPQINTPSAGIPGYPGVIPSGGSTLRGISLVNRASPGASRVAQATLIGAN